jgi:hypothetical protein
MSESVAGDRAYRRIQACFRASSWHVLVVCVLLACSRMPSAVAFLVSIISFAVLVAPAHAQVAPIPAMSAPHVRPERELRALVDEAAQGSALIRGLIDRLETLNVSVYVRARTFEQTDLEGRVALLTVVDGHRYLVIELACGRPRISQMAALGHELYHAVEIAEEPSVVDARTLAAFYERVGRRTDNWSSRQTFETEAAAAAGMRARRELFMTAPRRANGT